MKVLNFGSLNFDYVYQVLHIVRPGETLASRGRDTFPGGKGLNQSMALSRAGVPVFQAGTVGEDGGSFLTLCGENGIDTRYIQTVGGPSGHAIIQLDENSQNCILIYGGANRKQSRAHIDAVLRDFEKGDILLLQNEINELDYLIDRASEAGMTIVLNPSPLDSALDACDLSKVSTFLLNETEGAALAKGSDKAAAPEEPGPDFLDGSDPSDGSDSPEEPVSRLLVCLKKRFPNADIVLTLGEKGAVYQGHDGRIFKQKAIQVAAVDTTAAGDTFTGYYIAGLLRQMEIPDILKLCACASAIAVSRHGAAPSIPLMREVETFMRGIELP